MDRRRKTAVLYLLAGVAFLVGAVLESPPRWFSYVPAVLFVVLAILQFSGLRRQRRP
jgi:hypothetical protein